MRFDSLTWKEAAMYIKKMKALLLPMGSVEEHGYHLPLSTDSDIALKIAEELSKRTGIAYLPIISYGVCISTKDYPGTISISFDTLRALIRDIALSLEKNGIKKLFIISGHLGDSHIAAIKEACRDLKIDTYLLDLRKIPYEDIIETEPMHACELETSLMMYLHPNKIKPEKIKDENIVRKKFSLKGLEKTESGVFGFPSKASRSKGKKIFERIITVFENFIKEELKNI